MRKAKIEEWRQFWLAHDPATDPHAEYLLEAADEMQSSLQGKSVRTQLAVFNILFWGTAFNEKAEFNLLGIKMADTSPLLWILPLLVAVWVYKFSVMMLGSIAINEIRSGYLIAYFPNTSLGIVTDGLTDKALVEAGLLSGGKFLRRLLQCLFVLPVLISPLAILVWQAYQLRVQLPTILPYLSFGVSGFIILTTYLLFTIHYGFAFKDEAIETVKKRTEQRRQVRQPRISGGSE